jgi:hypothetical protein
VTLTHLTTLKTAFIDFERPRGRIRAKKRHKGERKLEFSILFFRAKILKKIQEKPLIRKKIFFPTQFLIFYAVISKRITNVPIILGT